MTKQYKWQLKQVALGNCRICGQPATGKNYCDKHVISHREINRRSKGCTKRYLNSRSYQLSANLCVSALNSGSQPTAHTNVP